MNFLEERITRDGIVRGECAEGRQLFEPSDGY